ncbi:hypothetical protein H4R34_001596 [Dimargaris verticillata]|uniref:Zinc finger C2H2 LYAR-type domain-containing protein n=1 Tax=Dimargaris verticillata TaxID=2761393 RepID=A0A9W8BAF3_9FUNG|nr:hypothetical protein H4R34_001596 [Dimargaris verticillata]
MVSFVCNACQETLKKPKLDQHRQRCRSAQFCCIDCSREFYGTEYRQHTSCISEAEKYQKALYKPKAKATGPGQATKTPAVASKQPPSAPREQSQPAKTTVPVPQPIIAQLQSANKLKRKTEDFAAEPKAKQIKKAALSLPVQAWQGSELPTSSPDLIQRAMEVATGTATGLLTLPKLRKQTIKTILQHPDNQKSKSDVKSLYDSMVSGLVTECIFEAAFALREWFA